MLATMLHFLFFILNLNLVLGGPYDNGLFGNDKFPIGDGRHSIDNGERKNGDELLYGDLPIEGGQPMISVSNEYCYPPKGSNAQVTITEYEVKDQDKGDNGGVAFELSGGVGQGQVCILIKTKPGGSYHYKIDVYGVRRNNGEMLPGQLGMGPFNNGMGFGNNGMRLGSNGMGLGNNGMGLGSNGMGLGSNGMGFGSNGMGLGSNGMGLGSNGIVPGSNGMGLGSNGMGLGSNGMGLGSNGMGLGSNGMGLGSNGIVPGNNGRMGSGVNIPIAGGANYGGTGSYSGNGNFAGGYGSGGFGTGYGEGNYGSRTGNNSPGYGSSARDQGRNHYSPGNEPRPKY